MTHPLKDYIGAADDTVSGFAARIGVSRQTLHRILSGAQTPKPALARRIAEATGGAVPFEMLYGETPDRLADLSSHRFDDDLDPDLLGPVVRFVLRALIEPGARAPDHAQIMTAAEAVANTHIALARITTRRGPDRLAQALRPVLEEILKDCLAQPVPPDRLDQAARCGGALYFQALPLRVRR